MTECKNNLSTYFKLGCLCLICLMPFANSCSQDAKKDKITGTSANPTTTDSGDYTKINDGSLEDGTDEGEQSLDDIIKTCGVKLKDLKNPDNVLLKKELRSWPKIFTGIRNIPLLGSVTYKVEVTTKVTINSKVGETTQTTDFDIKSTPKQAEKEAEKKVGPLRGVIKSKGFTLEQRTKLIGNEDQWAGVICTILPTKEVTVTRDGKSKKIKFSPALPFTVSPKADPSRYAAEIGESRVFEDIEAEILSSSDAGYPKGRKMKGRVVIRKVSPVLTLDIGGQSQQQVRADAAYRIEVDFGSDTIGLGFNKSQTLYIDHSERDLKIVVADTGLPEAGVVVLSDEIK